MARYIDVEKKIEEINRGIDSITRLIENRPYDEEAKLILREHEFCLYELECTPTVNEMEVKHGKWEIKSEIYKMFDDVDEEIYVECPYCKRTFYVPFEFEDEKILAYARKAYPYCNCGAKMDGGKTE